MHIAEYINKLVKSGKLKAEEKVNLSVTYHDPCRLGRLGEPWIHWTERESPVTVSFSTRRRPTGAAPWRL